MGWVRGLCDSFTEGIKDALDIHSPSRVMMKLGAYTGEGFGLGIESTIGSISKQSQAMADAVNPSLNIKSPSIGTDGIMGGMSSSSNSFIDTILEKMDSLEKALDISIDGKSIVKATAKGMSQELGKMTKSNNTSKGRSNLSYV